MVSAAGEDASDAADYAKKAAEIYKHIMSDNKLSFGEIKGSVEWKDDDLVFDITVILDFVLKFDLGWFDVDIDLSDIKLPTLHISLDEIIQIFEHAFKYIWEQIKKEL